MSLRNLQYELMLISRNYLKPHHGEEEVLDRSAYVLLSRLELGGPMSLKGLAAALGLDGSTIHRQTATLLHRGYLQHLAGAPGEVARRVGPTPGGLVALEESRKVFERGLHSVVGSWPGDKAARFEALLRDFNRQIEALEGTEWPRPDGATESGLP